MRKESLSGDCLLGSLSTVSWRTQCSKQVVSGGCQEDKTAVRVTKSARSKQCNSINEKKMVIEGKALLESNKVKIRKKKGESKTQTKLNCKLSVNEKIKWNLKMTQQL